MTKKNYKRLYEITVKHLLMMSSGFDEAYLMVDQRRKGVGYSDYLSFMLSRPLKVQPGSKFSLF